MPTVANNQVPDVLIVITGSNATGDGKQVVVIDVSNLPSGTIIELNNIDFVIIIGAVSAVGGADHDLLNGGLGFDIALQLESQKFS